MTILLLLYDKTAGIAIINKHNPCTVFNYNTPIVSVFLTSFVLNIFTNIQTHKELAQMDTKQNTHIHSCSLTPMHEFLAEIFLELYFFYKSSHKV